MSTELIRLDAKSPTGIEGIDRAKLPQVYEQAKRDLAEVTTIDEAKEWGSKAEAMAAYAKMKNDRELEKLFKAVRQHAEKRYGQLQKLVENRRGRPPKMGAGAPQLSPPKKRDEAQKAKDRRAARFASLPDDVFEEAVKEGKSDTAIEKIAVKHKAAPAINPKSEEYKHATKLLALMERVRADARNLSFEKALAGMTDDERDVFAEQVVPVTEWFASMCERLAESFEH